MPFAQCQLCGKILVESCELYLIEKSFGKEQNTGKQVLEFEWACCMACRVKTNESLSVESKQKLEAYFEANTSLEKRDEELKKHKLLEPEIWLHNCVVKHKSIDEVNEYQIYALCWRDELVFDNMPMMICGEAINKIMGLMSSESLEILNDIMADLIDLPPDFNEFLKNKKTPLFI